MSDRTAFLSKLIGIYCILVATPMAVNKQATIQMVTAAVNDAPVAFVFGLTLVATGLAIILAHNVWSGGALPVIVTIVGWLTLLKGLLFLFLPPPAAVGISVWGNAYAQFYYLDVALAFILGAYLTYGGFKSRAR
jgi:putative exporter of polyketide antibiotics